MATSDEVQARRRRLRLPRRRWARLLLLISGLAGVLLIGAVVVGAWMYSQARVDTVGDLTFDRPLRIPPVLEPELDGDRKVFDLQLQEGTSELLPGTETTTWGANGAYLAPTLRASRGDDVVINVENGLSEETTLRWHGMPLPANADGGPHQMVRPAETWSPSWTIDQRAATLWYHPHPHGRTADHVYRGLAGLFLLDDEHDVDLPDEYGVDDIRPAVRGCPGRASMTALGLPSCQSRCLWSGSDVRELLSLHAAGFAEWDLDDPKAVSEVADGFTCGRGRCDPHANRAGPCPSSRRRTLARRQGERAPRRGRTA